MDLEFAYKPGDVIQDFVEPFAKVLNDDEKGKRCDNCFKESTSLNRCAACKLMHYCDKKCQTDDWKLCHKFECKSDCFKMEIPLPEEGLLKEKQSSKIKRQILRLFGILKLHPELGDKQFMLYSGKTRCLNDLLSHNNETEVGAIMEASYCAEFGVQLEKEGHGISNSAGDGGMLAYLLKLFGIWLMNSFQIPNETESCIIGSGIYIESSLFNHSCKPDASIQFLGIKMQTRAVARIPKGFTPYARHFSIARGPLNPSAMVVHSKCGHPHCQNRDHGGNVDYMKLNVLILTAARQSDWKSFFKCHQEILKTLREIYHEYDERISNHIFSLFQNAGRRGAPKRDLIRLGKETEDHLRITYGEGSWDFREWMGIKRKFGLGF